MSFNWEIAFPDSQNNEIVLLSNDGSEKDRSIEEIYHYTSHRESPSSSYISSYDEALHSENVHLEALNKASLLPSLKENYLDKYRVKENIIAQTSEKMENGAKKWGNIKKNSSESSSDLLDKLSLIDLDRSGFDSLLSIPSPEKYSDFCCNTLISPITERTEKSDFSSNLINPLYNSEQQLGHDEESKVNDQNTLKSKIPIRTNRKFSNSSSESPSITLSNRGRRSSKTNTTSTRSKSVVAVSGSHFDPSFSLSSSSRSLSFLSLNAKSNRFVPLDHHDGRRCISSLGLTEDSNKNQSKNGMQLKKAKSKSDDNILKKIPCEYNHIKSKVRQYIDGIKSSECSRKPSPVRTNTNSLFSDSELAEVFLLDENLVNLDVNEYDLPTNLNSLVNKLYNPKENSELVKNILRILIQERKFRTEQEQTIATLQLEYDNLLAKQALSNNLIDELRLQINKVRSTGKINYVPTRAQSCSSTPRYRRHSSYNGILSEKANHFSSSQPNLIKSTTFAVTEPSLGLSIDQSGNVHFLPSPFESNISFPLSKTVEEDVVNQVKFVDEGIVQPDQNGFVLHPEAFPSNLEMQTIPNNEKESSVRTSEIPISGSEDYVNVANRLKDFVTLLRYGDLNRTETREIWESLLKRFSDMCKEKEGQQTTELLSLENVFRVLSKRYSLQLAISKDTLEAEYSYRTIERVDNQNQSTPQKNNSNENIRFVCKEEESDFCPIDDKIRSPFTSAVKNTSSETNQLIVPNLSPITGDYHQSVFRKLVSENKMNSNANRKSNGNKYLGYSFKNVDGAMDASATGREVDETGISQNDLSNFLTLQLESRPLTPLEKVEKWRASLPNLAILPSNLDTHDENCRVSESLNSIEGNLLKSKRSSSCSNLHLAKKVDVDSGCQISSSRSNKFASQTCHNSQLTTFIYEKKPQVNGSAHTSTQSHINRTIEVYPPYLKSNNDKSGVSDRNTVRFRCSPDISTSLCRMERELDFVKRKLGERGDIRKQNREMRQRREPVRVLTDYSFTSDTTSGHSVDSPKTASVISEPLKINRSRFDGDYISVPDNAKRDASNSCADLDRKQEVRGVKAISNGEKRSRRSRSAPRIKKRKNQNMNNLNDERYKGRTRKPLSKRLEGCSLCSGGVEPSVHPRKNVLMSTLQSATLLASKINSTSLEILSTLSNNKD